MRSVDVAVRGSLDFSLRRRPPGPGARLRLEPAFGRTVLRKLTVADMDGLLASKREAGYSPNSQRIIRAVLRRALHQAQREGLVARNVAALSTAPRIRAKEGRALTIMEARCLLDAVRGTRNEALLRTMLAFGLRRGEALGLRWSSLDWDAATLKVTRGQAGAEPGRGSGGARLVIGELKAARSRRTLFLTPPLVDLFRRHRVRQAEERMAVGEDHGLVLPSEVGTPLDPDDVSHLFSRICRTAGLGHWHLQKTAALGCVADAGAGHGPLRGVGGARALQHRDHQRRLRTPGRGTGTGCCGLMSRALLSDIGAQIGSHEA